MTLRANCLIAILAASACCAASPETGLIVHEWGTFTSVAGETGAQLQWAPLAGTPDLPCFVNRISVRDAKAVQASVRMETPVLYFYSKQAMALSVAVDFPHGWITEWYPKASRVSPHPEGSAANGFIGRYANGRVEWTPLAVTPDAVPSFPSTRGASRYYAARNTDSAPLQIAGQQEKLLFYRGIGNFQIPLQPRITGTGDVEVSNVTSNPVPLVMLFENRDGRIGFRMAHWVNDQVRVAPVDLNGDMDVLRRSLSDALTESGLYRKEADAMIETWSDSWFEPGMRLIYLVPRPMIESELPLHIAPAPSAIARVFVGRIELLSPSIREQIETVRKAGDTAALAKFGRFFPSLVNSTSVSYQPEIKASCIQ